MKKYLLIIALFVGSTSFVSAAAFGKGAKIIGPHVGYGWHGLHFGLWYDHGVHQYVGLGLQAEVTYRNWAGYGYGYVGGHDVGIRALFVISGHIPIRKVPELDLFIKLGLGYGNHIYPKSRYKDSLYVRHYFAWDLSLGVRYFFSKRVGVRAEVGWPTWFKFGVDFKI